MILKIKMILKTLIKTIKVHTIEAMKMCQWMVRETLHNKIIRDLKKILDLKYLY